MYDAYFQQMLTTKLWVPHGVTKKGVELYCPVVRFGGSLEDVYLRNNESREPVHREIPNRKALQKYGKSEARWRNNSILRDFYASRSNKTEKGAR